MLNWLQRLLPEGLLADAADEHRLPGPSPIRSVRTTTALDPHQRAHPSLPSRPQTPKVGKWRRLSPDEPDVDVEGGQDGNGPEGDVPVEGLHLKSEEEGERKGEIQTDQGSGVHEDLTHGMSPLVLVEAVRLLCAVRRPRFPGTEPGGPAFPVVCPVRFHHRRRDPSTSQTACQLPERDLQPDPREATAAGPCFRRG